MEGPCGGNHFSTESKLVLGIFGLQAARTYLDIHPEAKIIVLEKEDHVGGVWSKCRF
jgi:hypothetical protein